MIKQKSTKCALLLSALSLLMCVSMLIGSTFAWFTDSVTSGNNVIKAGKLDIVMEYWNGTEWVDAEGKVLEFQKASTDAGSEVLWEPGCTYELPKFRVRNVGNLAAKILIKLNGVTGDEKLMEAIDLTTTISNMPESVLNGSQGAQLGQFNNTTFSPMYGTPDGTIIFDWSLMGAGNVSPNSGHTDTSPEFTISGHMKEEAGNEYQGLMIQGISITVLATQEVYEYDSFGREYDKNSPFPEVETPAVEITSEASLNAAIANGKTNLKLANDIEVSASISITGNVVISGGKTISRAEGFTGDIIVVENGATLTVKDAVIDGGAVWVNTASDDVTNSGVVATGDLIEAKANASIILENGAVLQNNDGAFAVNLGTRIGATLTMNGGEIIYNRSDAGAVWGGGHITINDGKINNNSSTGIGGAIRMVGKCNFTMNGGEICDNVATTDGGAIWGYGVNGNSSVYNLNGGKINNNTAGGIGGAFYFGTYSTINLSGDMEICGNTAANSGAFRLTNYNNFNMTGGKVSGNTSTDNANYSASYAWTAIVKITGGEFADNITIDGNHTPTVGGDGISGVVHFTIGTNHNTVNLTADFGTIKFTVDEADSNFSQFNFKPAADYTYSDGDETKLVCMNDGYETYWNADEGVFRLQAK